MYNTDFTETDNIIPAQSHKRCYLVDYSNTGYSGLNGIEELDNSSDVIIFYGENAESIPIEFFRRFIECKAEISFYPIESGDKNIINFQISTYIGYILGDDKNAECCIVSGDRGFEAVRNFWKAKGTEIRITSDISGKIKAEIKLAVQSSAEKTADEPVEEVTETEKTDFDVAVEHLNLNKNYKYILYTIFREATKLTFAQRLNYASSEIAKNFPYSKQSECYQAIKPLLLK